MRMRISPINPKILGMIPSVDEVETNSKSDRGTAVSGKRGRPLARVLAGGLVKLCWSGVRGTIRFPRTSAAAAMSTLILGSILFTQPAKSTPKNQIPSSPPTSSQDEKKGVSEKAATKPDLTSIAKDVPPSKSPNEGKAADRSDQPAAPASSEESLPPLPGVGADGGPTDSLTKHPQTEKATTPTSQSVVPAPLPTIGQDDANLLSQSSHDPAPTPLPSPATSSTLPEPVPAPTLTGGTSKDSGPGELPPVPSSFATDLDPPSQATLATPRSSTVNRSAERVAPPADAELESTSVAIDGDRSTKHEDAAGTTPQKAPSSTHEQSQPTSGTHPTPLSPVTPKPDPATKAEPPKAETPKAAPVTKTEPPKAEAQKAATSPVSEPLKAANPVQTKSEDPKPAPRTIPAPTKSEDPKPAPSTKSGTPKAEDPKPTPPITEPSRAEAPKTKEPALPPGQSGAELTTQRPDPIKPEAIVSPTEVSKPGVAEQEPALPIQGLKPEPVTLRPDPSPGLESPVQAPELLKLDDPNPGAISGPGTSKPETLGAETTGPRVLKPEDLTPSPEEGASRSQAAIDQPMIQRPIAKAGPLSVKEAPDRPDPIRPSPISRTDESRPEGPDAKGDALGAKPGDSPAQASRSSPNSNENPALAGWVRLPNTGKSSRAVGEDRFDAVGGVDRSVGGTRRDPRAHADKEVIFEAESSRTQPRIRSGKTDGETEDRPAPRPSSAKATASGSRLPNESAAPIESTRVEAVPHIVERGESFWTISRLYYGSGRYYRALWKANDQKYPRIDVLHVKDMIIIPPVEDLDAAFIDPARSRVAVAGAERTGRGGASQATTGSPVSPPRSDSLPTTRTTRVSGSSSMNPIPTRRSNRTSAVLELPIGDSGSTQDRSSRLAGAEVSGEGTLDDGPEFHVSARPPVSAPVSRPTYKVRRYDTLRSIARDTLGNPRRADEILEINREIIDDPNHLITGQRIQLPEDADTRRVTVRDRD